MNNVGPNNASPPTKPDVNTQRESIYNNFFDDDIPQFIEGGNVSSFFGSRNNDHRNNSHRIKISTQGNIVEDSLSLKSLRYSSKSQLTNNSLRCKLLKIIHDNTDEGNFKNALAWDSQQQKLIIQNPRILIEQVMPRYYRKIDKLASFERQRQRHKIARAICEISSQSTSLFTSERKRRCKRKYNTSIVEGGN